MKKKAALQSATLDEFLEVIGDVSVASVTRMKIGQYLDIAQKLPNNRRSTLLVS